MVSGQPCCEVNSLTRLYWLQEGSWDTGNGGNNEHVDFLTVCQRHGDNNDKEKLTLPLHTATLDYAVHI